MRRDAAPAGPGAMDSLRESRYLSQGEASQEVERKACIVDSITPTVRRSEEDCRLGSLLKAKVNNAN